MNGFWAVSITLQAFFNYVECSTSTRGHFFRKTSDNVDEESNNDGGMELFLREEFFTCDGEKACSNVVKKSSSGYEVLKADEEVSKAKENWKKIPLVSRGKPSFNKLFLFTAQQQCSEEQKINLKTS